MTKEEIPRTAYCASTSLQRGKNYPVAKEGTSEKGAVPGQEDGIDQEEEERENTTESKVKEVKTMLSFKSCGRFWRWCLV